MKIKPKFYTITLWVILMGSSIAILDISFSQDQSEAILDVKYSATTSSIPVEEGVFRRSKIAADNQFIPEYIENERTLDTYYDNRAYHGAPPTVPHPLLSEKGIGENSCLQCHENGGYVDQFKAYTPVTPHPEMLNCKQCHVPMKTSGRFVENAFKGKGKPGIKNNALPGSPPVIPHALQMRSNCLSCHAGPSAPKEIRVSHPERSNCRQCHVTAKNITGLIEWVKKDPTNESIIWERESTEK